MRAIPADALCGGGLLHRQLGLEIVEIAIDRGDGEHPALALVTQQTIFRFDIAVDGNVVPLRGVADIVDRHVRLRLPFHPASSRIADEVIESWLFCCGALWPRLAHRKLRDVRRESAMGAKRKCR